MEPTTCMDQEISEALTEYGIVHKISEYGGINVNRTSMCTTFPKNSDERASYTETLILIRIVCGDKYYVSWSGRTDDVLVAVVSIRPTVIIHNAALDSRP